MIIDDRLQSLIIIDGDDDAQAGGDGDDDNGDQVGQLAPNPELIDLETRAKLPLISLAKFALQTSYCHIRQISSFYYDHDHKSTHLDHPDHNDYHALNHSDDNAAGLGGLLC